MNVHERVFRESLALSKSILATNTVTPKHQLRWKRLSRAMKKHKHFMSRRYTLRNQLPQENGDYCDFKTVANLLEHYSDRWTRSRMYNVDTVMKALIKF